MGQIENRMVAVDLQIINEIKILVWPEKMPLFVRLLFDGVIKFYLSMHIQDAFPSGVY